MAKPVLMIRRGDTVIVKNRRKKPMRRPPSINTFSPAGYRRRVTSENMIVRENTPAPDRDTLTKKQWIERGDLLKIAKVNQYIGAERLSLANLRDAVRSIQICQNLRLGQY